MIEKGCGCVDVFMCIFNNEGGEVDVCGNVICCIVKELVKELNCDWVVIEINVGFLKC